MKKGIPNTPTGSHPNPMFFFFFFKAFDCRELIERSFGLVLGCIAELTTKSPLRVIRYFMGAVCIGYIYIDYIDTYCYIDMIYVNIYIYLNKWFCFILYGSSLD